jgi:transcriptional regulator GlxA family with amidase domain
MDRNYLEPATLAQLADMASLGVSQFSDVFRRLTGAPPKAYLLARRLDHAAALLSSTHQTVAQVAATAGFDSLPHFHELFRRRRGVTPAEFRKNADTGPKKP